MKNYLFIIIISIFIPGCSSLTLSTDYDQSIDFSGFKTYRWHADNEHNSASLRYLNEIVDKRIRSTIDQQLQGQGFTKSDNETADFLVNYSIVVEDRTDIQTYNNYNGMYPGYAYRGGYGYYVGESLFLRKLVLGIPAQASDKNLTRPLLPSAPSRPAYVPLRHTIVNSVLAT